MLHPISGGDPPRVTPIVHIHQRDIHTLAVVPAYDEGRCIGSVVLRVKTYVDQVLVVDDGSNDDTAQIAEAAGATVLRHDHNRGKGHALNIGLARARQLGAGAVVLIDGDGQHRAEEIPDLLGPILSGEADVVVGSRYLQAHEQVPRHRVLGHKALNWLTNAVSGVHLTDTQNGFRALSSRALEVFRFSSQGFSVESEMQFLIREHKLRCVEAPVTTLYPDKPKRSAVAQGLEVLGGLAHRAIYCRPIEFLLLPGLGLLMIGLVLGMPVIESAHLWSRPASALALLSMPIMIVGTQIFCTGMILYAIRCRLAGALGVRQVDERKEAERGAITQGAGRISAAPDEHHRRQP
jgi:glycosyltransferase involved in cell wall biosynthesis